MRMFVIFLGWMSLAVATSTVAHELAVDDRRLVIKLIDDEAGKPLPSGAVRLAIHFSSGPFDYRAEMRTAIIDRQGQVAISNLPTQPFMVTAFHRNLTSRPQSGLPNEVQPSDKLLEFRMRVAPSLKVKVVDKTKQQPLPGAIVQMPHCRDGDWEYVTNEEGEVLLSGLSKGGCHLEVYSSGYAKQKRLVGLVEPDTKSVTIELEPGLDLVGVVRDDKNQPIEGVVVNVGGDHPYNPLSQLDGEFTSALTNQFPISARTDARGRYRLSSLPRDRLQLTATKTGYVTQNFNAIPKVAPFETQQLDVILPAQTIRSVEGIIVDAKGTPVAGAQVINGYFMPVQQTETDEKGRYRLDGVHQGLYGTHTLLVKATGFAPKLLKFEPGTRDDPAKVDVTLAKGHHLRGQVVDQFALPIADAFVLRSDDYSMFGGGQIIPIITDSEGKFEITDLPKGVTFSIRETGFISIEDKSLPLDGEEATIVQMEMEPEKDRESPTQIDGVIRGRVTDADSKAILTEFVVNAVDSVVKSRSDGLSPGVNSWRYEKEWSKGEFILQEIPRDKPLDVRVDAEGYRRGFMHNVIAKPTNEAELIEVRLQPVHESELVTIAGNIVDIDGRGIAGIDVYLMASAEPREQHPIDWNMIRENYFEYVAGLSKFDSTMTDYEGRFEFREVHPAEDIEIVYWGEGISQGRLSGVEEFDPLEQKRLRIVAEPRGRVMGEIDRNRFEQFDTMVLKQKGNLSNTHVAKLLRDGKAYEITDTLPGIYDLEVGRWTISEDQANKVIREVLYRRSVKVKSGETTVINVEN